MTDNRDPAEWKTVHEIAGPDDVLIRVQRRGDRRPLYSLEIGRKRLGDTDPTPRLGHFVPVRILTDGKVEVSRSIEELVRQANDWVLEDAMHFEAAYLQRRDDHATPKRKKAGGARERDREWN